jgi:hypothetical protein
MAVSGDGRIYVVYELSTTLYQRERAWVMLAEYDGVQWLPPVPITDGDRNNWDPDVAVDTLGHPHVVWGEELSGEVLYKSFNGNEWSPAYNISQNTGPSYFPQIAIDTKNRIHVVWHDHSPERWSVYYSRHDSTGWSAATNITSGLSHVGFPRLATATGETLHVTFHSQKSASIYDIYYLRGSSGAWGEATRITNDSNYCNYPDISLDTTNTPVLVWQQDMQEDFWPPLTRIRLTRLRNGQWSEPISIADTTESEVPCICIDQKDRIHIAWELLNRASGTYSVLYTSGHDSTWDEPQSLMGSLATLTGAASRIEVDQSGTLHAIWAGFPPGGGLYAPADVFYTKKVCIVSGAVTSGEVPTVVRLMQNYPNPFNGTTVLRYILHKGATVTLSVHDILGREIAILDSGHRGPGEHVVTYQATGTSSGVYIVRLQAEQHVSTIRMVLVR